MYSQKFSEKEHCHAVQDQWNCVLNDLEELGNKKSPSSSGHSGRNLIDPSLQDNVKIPNDFFEYIITEELGDDEFLVLTDHCNIEIFSGLLRLLPLYLPHIIRLILRVLKFVPKIFCKSPEFDRSILLSK